MVDREAVVLIDHPGVDRPVAYPGAPYRFERTPWAIRRRPPGLGADTAAVLEAVASRDAAVDATP
jgi:benzylsuccinate CoA-transferase BbsE subunit